MGDESSCTCKTSESGMPCNTRESASAINITISVFAKHLEEWLGVHARRYSSEQPNVNITVVNHNISDGLSNYAEMIADDRDGSKHGYHGFLSYPHLFGIHKDNIHEISDFVRRNEEKIKWSDILAFYRQNNAVNGNGGIYFIPLDDNANLIFYRMDLFSDHNITVPRTWEEFNSAAKYFHNANLIDKNNDVPVSGLCIRRHARCGMGLMLSMITGTIAQIAGTNQGSLFDPVLQTFVDEVVLNKTLNLIEEQVKYGHPEDFKEVEEISECAPRELMKGECALTYGVPSIFLSTPMQKFMNANIGFAPLPGSEIVWNRQKNTLEKCDSKTCVYGKSFDDIGIVNYSPYFSPNSVVGGVSKWASDEERQSVLEFFSYVSINSFDDAVPNMTDNITVVQPYRRSHLNVSRWIAQGYDEEEALMMIASYESPNDPNANVSPRIGEFSGFLEELSTYTSSYLSNAVQGNVTDSNRTSFVTSISDLAESYFTNEYTGGKAKFYEDYQKSLGIYQDPAVQKYLSFDMMVYGVALGCLVVLSAIGIGCWVYCNRFDKLNKFFRPALMIWTCVGSTLVGIGICIMATTDDDRYSDKACDYLCNVMYCLFLIGQSVILWVSGAKIICNFEVSNAKWFNRQYHLISSFDLLRSALMTIMPTLCCLGGFMIFDQPKWERVPSDGDNYALSEVWGQCSRSYFSSYFLGVNVLLFVVMTIMSIIALFCCSRDRLEKPWQLLVLSTYLQSVVIGIPILILFSDSADSLYISFVTLHFFIAMGPLIIPVIPLTIIRQQIEEKYILMAKNAAKREAALSEYKEELRTNIRNIEEILHSNNDFKRSRHLKRIRRSADKWLRSDLCDLNDSDKGARREYRSIRLQKMESRVRRASLKYKDGDLGSARRPILRHTGKSFSKMSRFSVEFSQFAGPSHPNSRLGSLRNLLSFRASSGTHTFGDDDRNSNENGVIFNDEEISSESLCDECDLQMHED